MAESVDERTESITLTGGEPTLHPELPEILSGVRELTSASLALETNGTALARPGVAAALKDWGVSLVRLTVPSLLDGAISRVRQAPDIARQALAACREANLAVEAVLPVGRWNVESLSKEVAALAEYGPKSIEFQPLKAEWLPQRGESVLVPMAELAASIAAAAPRARQKSATPRMGEPLPYCLAGGMERLPEMFAMPRQTIQQWGEEHKAAYKKLPCAQCSLATFCPGPPSHTPQPWLAPQEEEAISAWAEVLEPLVGGQEGLFDLHSSLNGEGHEGGVFTIRLTPRCNIHCQHCWWTDWGRPDTPILFAKRHVKKAIDLGYTTLAISGGEPTLIPGLDELIAYARSLREDVLIELQTNALRCANQEYTRKLAEAGLDTAFTTFLASTKELYEEETEAPGTYEKALAGIRNLQREGVLVALNYVVNALNYQDLPRFVRWFHREFPHEDHPNPVYINICAAQPINPDLMAMDHLFPPYPVMKPFFWEAVEYCLEHGIVISGLNSISGIPHCVLDGDHRIFDPGERQYSEANDVFTYIEACESCMLKGAECQGIRRNYLKLHGPEGFYAIKDRREYPPSERLYQLVERRIPSPHREEMRARRAESESAP